LTETRQKIFEYTYGFHCECDSCRWIGGLDSIPSYPERKEDVERIGERLRAHVRIEDLIHSGSLSVPSRSIPSELTCVLGESYMTSLSGNFSKYSHEGQYDSALDAGITLTALYLLVYPRNYPQIGKHTSCTFSAPLHPMIWVSGLHLLEVAKVAWNAYASSTAHADSSRMIEIRSRAEEMLSLARQTLSILGEEGDEDGPFKEIEVLQSLLKDEQMN
jgi:hypothetical protein